MTWTSEQIMQTIGKHMLNECITNARLAELTSLQPKQIENSTGLLKQHGFIEVVEPGCYCITKAGITALESNVSMRSGPKNPHKNARILKDTLRTRVWRAIRIRQNFSIPELVGLVANGSEKDAESNIGKYLRVLESAGYLIRMRKRLRGTAMTSNGFARWRLDLEKDTGPQAPVWRRGKDTVFDPNNGDEITLTQVKEGA